MSLSIRKLAWPSKVMRTEDMGTPEQVSQLSGMSCQIQDRRETAPSRLSLDFTLTRTTFHFLALRAANALRISDGFYWVLKSGFNLRRNIKRMPPWIDEVLAFDLERVAST